MKHFVVTWYLLIDSAICNRQKFAQAAKTFKDSKGGNRLWLYQFIRPSIRA